MAISDLIQDTVFVLGILGVLFGIYQYFRNPQVAEDKRAALLAQQVKTTSTSVEQRFESMQKNFEGLLLQSNNHIHSLDIKIDAMNKAMTDMRVEVATLSTIIDERIPKKI
jgi:uncharacterized protein HemX